MARRRTGGSEMRVGDVWKAPSGRTWLVTGISWDGVVMAVLLDAGDTHAVTGTEVRLSDDRFAMTSWTLVQEAVKVRF